MPLMLRAMDFSTSLMTPFVTSGEEFRNFCLLDAFLWIIAVYLDGDESFYTSGIKLLFCFPYTHVLFWM